MGSLAYIAFRLLLLARDLALALVPLWVRYQRFVCRVIGHDPRWPNPEVWECRRCRHVEGSRHAVARLRNERLTEWMRLRAEREKGIVEMHRESLRRSVDRTV